MRRTEIGLAESVGRLAAKESDNVNVGLRRRDVADDAASRWLVHSANSAKLPGDEVTNNFVNLPLSILFSSSAIISSRSSYINFQPFLQLSHVFIIPLDNLKGINCDIYISRISSIPKSRVICLWIQKFFVASYQWKLFLFTRYIFSSKLGRPLQAFSTCRELLLKFIYFSPFSSQGKVGKLGEKGFYQWD